MNDPDAVILADAVALQNRPFLHLAAWPPVMHVQGAPSAADYDDAAKELGSDVAGIKAVAVVKTGIRRSWDPDGRSIILYGRRLFSSMTANECDPSHPDISNPNR